MSVAQENAALAPAGKRSLLFHPDEQPSGTWPVFAAQLFRERMLNPDDLFPCIFGVDAVRRGTLRFSFIPVGESRAEILADALLEFTEIAPSLGQRTSLVCFFEHDPRLRSLEECRQHFWWLLGRLCQSDTSGWPEGISLDPEDPAWEFSYQCMPMFVVASTPFHQRRRSRYFEYFLMTFQPRFVFANLEAGTPRGDNARKIIRRRLAEYDLVERTPLLGSFGAPGNKEWEQYFLDDDNMSTASSSGCPLYHTSMPACPARPDDR